MRKGLTLLVVATLGVIAALALVDALKSSPHPSAAGAAPQTRTSSSTTTHPPLVPAGTRKDEIEATGNTWAPLYAAGDPKACVYMDPTLCGLKPLPSFRASFEGATVQDMGFRDAHRAEITFSNGIVVGFENDTDIWWIAELPSSAHGG